MTGLFSLLKRELEALPIKRHLRYCMQGAFTSGETKHPQIVMKKLGINCQKSTPQSIADQWWFWNCENIPDPLPDFLTELLLNPFDVIGYGLSKEDAELITTNKL